MTLLTYSCTYTIYLFTYFITSHPTHRPTELWLINKIPQWDGRGISTYGGGGTWGNKIPQRKFQFNTTPVYVRFLVHELAQSQGFLGELRIFPVTIIAPNLHTHSFTHLPAMLYKLYISQSREITRLKWLVRGFSYISCNTAYKKSSK